MKYFQIYFISFLIISFQYISSKNINVEYNEKSDFIIKDGKYYFPVSVELTSKNLKNIGSKSQFRNLEAAETQEK